LRAACTVVIPTRDRPAMLQRALASVAAAVGPDDEVIVVDSASRTPVEVPNNARLLRCDLPGASRARNIGWRAAASDVVAFVDDDVVVDAGWAEALVEAFEAHPQAAFVTTRIAPLTAVDYPVAVKEETAPESLGPLSRGVLGHSASTGFRRAALVGTDGFDELLGAGARYQAAEDLDLFDRLFAAGWTGWYEPAAMAWHDQWRTKGQRMALAWTYGVGMGARLAKLQRRDTQRAVRLARETIWETQVHAAAHHARRGYKTALLLNVLNVGGAATGWARATPLRVVNGHFAPRR
jgi:GT2 family glycosyltransferase